MILRRHIQFFKEELMLKTDYETTIKLRAFTYEICIDQNGGESDNGKG